MKTERNRIVLLIIVMVASLLTSCEEEADYSHIIFKNYLTYEINRATGFLNTVTEGTAEGAYNAGSKQAYMDVINAAKLVDDDPGATQEEVDLAYQSLLHADEDFFDQMVPFRSDFEELIEYAEVVLDNTEEGEQEGNVKAGNKALLQEAVDEAEQLLATAGLTQRMLDQGNLDLNGAIYSFNSAIIGKATLPLVNPGFELPGYATEDFGEVDGWSPFGVLEGWAPKASVIELETATEGSFAARIGSYTQGIYQEAEEMIQPNAEYILEFDVALLSNAPDWQGKKFPAILLTRMIIFGEDPGDYLYASILSESYDTLGIDPGEFVHLSQSLTISAISEAVGEKIAIDFEQRHTWDAENPIWAESFVALDNIRLYRKL